MAAREEEEEEEATVSLVDVLEEDEDLEQEASAVLGGSDSEHCSYSQGYVKRQALYACNTCTPKGGEAAGICLACSYKCHEGHDLFELYTKRNFRCDCGNSKFRDLRCKFYPEKEPLNGQNRYSHNFFGLYCTCNRPYPDPEDQVEDEMIQCIICEDWLHGRHLGRSVPDCMELQEMICGSCMNNSPFLWMYAAQLTGNSKEKKTEKEEDQQQQEETEEASSSFLSTTTTENSETAASCKRSRQQLQDGCRLQQLQEVGPGQSGAVFWPPSWRSKLCTCLKCQGSYSAAGVSFLLDSSDTVLDYETRGRSQEPVQGHDLLMSALEPLNRVQQLEIIHEYNDMKSELKDFLQRFAAEGKVVTPDDITGFFEQQQTRKRRRVDAAQLHCS